MKYILPTLLFFIFLIQKTNGQADSTQKVLQKYPNSKKIEILLDKSEELRKQGNSRSINYSEQALSLSRKHSSITTQAKALYALGHAHYSFNHYTKAIEAFEEALLIYRNRKDKKGVALCLNRLGNTYQLQNNLHKALNHYFDALYINKEIKNEKELGRTYSNLARIYRVQGNFKKALDFSLQSLKLYKKVDYTEGIAWTALGTARLYKKINNFDKALSYLDQSEKIYESLQIKEGNKTGVLLCLKERAEIARLQGNYEKALKQYKEVLNLFIKSNNNYGEANTLLNIAKIHYDRGNLNKALTYLKESSEKKSILKDSTYLSDIYKYKGLCYSGLNKYNPAIENLMKALEEARKKNLKENILSIYNDLSSIYLKHKNPGMSLFYFKKYAVLKDSLFNDEITKLELQFEFDKKQEQKETLHKAELKSQRIITYTSAIVSALLLLLIIVIFRSYKQKQKKNQLLRVQNNEIKQQKEEIETQRDQVTLQRDEIIKQKNIITDSIQYASKIQGAALPQKHVLKEMLHDYFIYYIPKNIVSGDFYWVSQINGKTIIAAADCTGHGVPGAFMSMLGISLLNEIVNKKQVVSAADILIRLRENVIQSLHQEKKYGSPKDGMDIAICIINKHSLMMEYAGANNSVYILRNKELSVLKPDKMPIGVYSKKTDTPFTSQQYQLEENDMLYLFSDGYYDQFGGPKGDKLKQKSFKNLLTDISDQPTEKQLAHLDAFKTKWQGKYKQVDDILVIGLRI